MNKKVDKLLAEIAGEEPASGLPPRPTGTYRRLEVLVAEMRPHLAVLTHGGKVNLILETRDGFEVISRNDAKTLFSTAKYQTTNKRRETILKDAVDVYLESPDRVEFAGLTTNPAAPFRSGELYTTWRGFNRKARQGSWSLMKKHMQEVVCAGDPVLFLWLMCWIAQMIQQPGKKLSTAVVLKGERGVGKSMVGDWLREIIGKRHSRKISQGRHLTGNFNAHLRDVLFLQVEEGVWGGDKAAEGALKDLISGATIMVEQKRIDAVELENFTRIMITSNEEHVVPAGKTERRFLFLSCIDRFAGKPENHPDRKAYFDPIHAEAANGGLEAMLYDLERFDFTQVDLRRPPVTEGLRGQQAQSFSDEQEWLLSALMLGQFTTRDGESVHDAINHDAWSADKPLEITTAALIKSYRDHVRRWNGAAAGTRRMLAFLKSAGEITPKRLTVGRDRPPGYVLAPRRTWEARFARDYGVTFDHARGELVGLDGKPFEVTWTGGRMPQARLRQGPSLTRPGVLTRRNA